MTSTYVPRRIQIAACSLILLFQDAPQSPPHVAGRDTSPLVSAPSVSPLVTRPNPSPQQVPSSPTPLDLKFVFSIVPLVLAVLQFQTTLRKRRQWSRRAKEELGPFGPLFFKVDWTPHVLLSLAIAVVFFLSLWAVIQGAVLYDSLQLLDGRIGTALFENSIWIVIVWLILAPFIHYNLCAQVRLWWASRRRPETTYSPEWVSAARHIRYEEDAFAINIERNRCVVVANELLKVWKGRTAPPKDAAIIPKLTDGAQLANYYLFECIIEGELAGLHKSLTNWNDLFKALESAAEQHPNLFSPEALTKLESPQAFYTLLRSKTTLPNALPDEPSVAAIVAEALLHLRERYEGNAQKVAARGWWRERWLASNAEKRLEGFPGLRGPDRQANRAQFIKLATAANVWLGMDPGAFIIPFYAPAAKLLFDTGCVVVQARVDAVPLSDQDIRHVVARSEETIAKEVRRIASPGLRLMKRLGNEMLDFAVAPDREVLEEVDFLIWSESRSRSNCARTWKIDDKWVLDGPWLKRSKAG
jgi:hypothetical protein